MKTIVVLINGITLPYHVIDYAIDKAKKESCEIFVLFLKGMHEPSKGYGFPSDLGSTETWTSDEEAVKADEEIISANMRLIKELIEYEKIPYRLASKTNAAIEDVEAITATAELVVVDENFDDASLLEDNKISLDDLKDKIAIPVQVVRNEKSTK